MYCSHGTKIAYILSLGVLKEYRGNGVASFMLGNLLSHLRSGEEVVCLLSAVCLLFVYLIGIDDHRDVRAVYLHVLTTNNAAITFYEHRGFKPHLFLPYYYNIKGEFERELKATSKKFRATRQISDLGYVDF